MVCYFIVSVNSEGIRVGSRKCSLVVRNEFRHKYSRIGDSIQYSRQRRQNSENRKTCKHRANWSRRCTANIQTRNGKNTRREKEKIFRSGKIQKSLAMVQVSIF